MGIGQGRGAGIFFGGAMFGLDRAALRVARFAQSETDDGVTVEIETIAICADSSSGAVHTHRYTIDARGQIAVENRLTVYAALPDLPRLGVVMLPPPDFEALSWFGRGPRESYSDRKRQTWIGQFSPSVSAQYVPYVIPQEHGNTTDLRWLSLAAPFGTIRVAPSVPCEGSASHFTVNDLFAASHTIDLRPRPETFLSLDGHQRGLGTANCGPDTRPPISSRLDPARWISPFPRRSTGKRRHRPDGAREGCRIAQRLARR